MAGSFFAPKIILFYLVDLPQIEGRRLDKVQFQIRIHLTYYNAKWKRMSVDPEW